MYIPYFVYPLICWQTFVFPPFGYYECYEHWCANTCSSPCVDNYFKSILISSNLVVINKEDIKNNHKSLLALGVCKCGNQEH